MLYINLRSDAYRKPLSYVNQEFCERTLCRNYSFRSPFSSQMPEIAAILLANSINYTPIFIFNPKNHKLSGFTS